MIDNWHVTIHTVNSMGKQVKHESDVKDKQEIARLILTFRPKRGYTIISYNVLYAPTLF